MTRMEFSLVIAEDDLEARFIATQGNVSEAIAAEPLFELIDSLEDNTIDTDGLPL